MTIQEFVQRADPASPPLPVIHMTRGIGLESVLKQGLQPAVCPTFQERLLYFFYGRPAYKDEPASDSADDTPYMPVAFILPLSAIGSILKVHPFDTGAFRARRYSRHVPADFTLDHFALDPHPTTPARVVTAFFGSNRSYYEGTCAPYCEPDPLDFSTTGHIAGLRDNRRDLADDRRYTVELAVTAPVRLGEALEAMVLPNNFLQSRAVQQFLRQRSQVKPLTYVSPFATEPAGMYYCIYQKVFEYLEAQGKI